MDYTITVSTGERTTVIRAPGGTSLMEALQGGGVHIPAACGGRGTCGKCQVIVDKPSDDPPNATETRLLRPEALRGGVRLACTRKVERDLSLRVHSALEGAVIATGSRTRDGGVMPDIIRTVVTVPPPGLEDQRSDESRLLAAAGCRRIAWSALPALSGAVRRAGGEVTVIRRDGRLLDVRPGAAGDAPLGVAVDIGTTTLAAYLMDLETGRELSVASRLNPQKAYGDDVITRTDFVRRRPDGLETLRALVRDAVNAMIGELCQSAGAAAARVMKMTVAGNTVMMHLLAGVSPENIAAAPFIPAFTGAQETPAERIGVRAHPEATVILLPCISGYVGADSTAVALATEIIHADKPCLVLDIGTNGEILLGDRSGVTACSTAAGPAFEGAHIRFGMGGVAGAVSRVAMKDGLTLETIAGKPAVGLCGSAIVDIVAGLLRHGALDETGLLTPAGPAWLRDRFVEEEQGWSFRVVGPGEGGREVVFCQRDVREVQLAKAAVAAGIAILLNERRMDESGIGAVYLAGGFGSFIDPATACRIGLIPPALLPRIEAVGNGAGAGAKRALLSTAQMEECARIAEATRYVELSARPDFQDVFVESMMFAPGAADPPATRE